MSDARMQQSTLRLERAESSRLAAAFAFSLAAHLLIFSSYETGKKFGWWQQLHWPAWMQSVKMLSEILKKKENAPPPVQQEPPLMFVNVSPAQATTEPPKDTQYYSDKNSRAANPETDLDSTTPKISGKQTEVPKTEDVPREKFTPLQPARPVESAKAAQEEIKPKATYAPGDLTLAKPDPNPRKDDGQASQSRPRTIKEALARQQDNRLPGEKLKQEGGVRRHLEISSLDARATPFGAYDAALVEAISQRWFSLLDQRDFAFDGRGKVVLQFRLHYDGRITDLSVAENSAGELLGLICEKAVLDPAPFAVWPGDMRRMLGDLRSIQFTFYYY